MNEDTTLPPHQPNTPRVWIRRVYGWLRAHPDVGMSAALAAGLLIGLAF